MSKQRATEIATDAINDAGPISDSLPVLFPPLELPDANAGLYLSRFNLGAVYVAAGTAGFPCAIGSGTDLAAELAAVRRVWPKDAAVPELLWCAWCYDPRTAQQVATVALASDLRSKPKDGRGILCSVEQASAALIAAAQRLGFRLTDHAAVLERIRTTGAALETKLDAAQTAGVLKEFNQEFKRRRVAAQLAGKRPLNYREARAPACGAGRGCRRQVQRRCHSPGV
jgi:hypothetical protein